MQQVYKLVTLQDPSLQNIEICFILLRICHQKFELDTLCPLDTSRVKRKEKEIDSKLKLFSWLFHVFGTSRKVLSRSNGEFIVLHICKCMCMWSHLWLKTLIEEMNKKLCHDHALLKNIQQILVFFVLFSWYFCFHFAFEFFFSFLYKFYILNEFVLT